MNPLARCKAGEVTRITLPPMLVVMLVLVLGSGCGGGTGEKAATSTTTTVSPGARAAFIAEIDRLGVRGGIQDGTLYNSGVVICNIAGRSQQGLDQAVADLVGSKTPDVRDNLLTIVNVAGLKLCPQNRDRISKTVARYL